MTGKAPPRPSLWTRFGEPLGLARRPEGWALFALCAAFLLGLTAIDARVEPSTTVGALEVVPVLAAGWLLSLRQLVGLVLLASLLRAYSVAAGGVMPLTASTQVVVLPFLAVVSHAAALGFQGLRARAASDALISRVASLASSAGSLEAILNQVLTEMAREGLRGGTISLIDGERMLYIAAAEGELDASVLALRLPLGEGIMGRVAAEGTSIMVRDLQSADAPPSPTREIGSNRRIRSIAAVPMRSAGEVIGVLEVDSSEPGRFDDDDLRLLEQLATAISATVQRAEAQRLVDESLRNRISELATLLDSASGLVRSLDPAEILDTVVRSSARIAVQSGIGERRATIFRLEGDEIVVAAEYDELGRSYMGMRLPLAEHASLQRALDSTQAIAEPVLDMRGQAGEVLAESGFVTAAYAAIRVGDVPFGAIGVVGRRGRHQFSADELRLLDGMAHLAGLALGNAERFQLAQRRTEELRLHSERMAALDKVKSEFLRLASHELRGPLTVLRGYIDMLADGSFGELGPGAGAAMPVLRTKVEEMARLIDQMLETARLEDSRLQLVLEEIDLRSLVTASAQALEAIAAHAHRLTLTLPPDPVPALVDPARITTVITNLIDNAIKYSPEGGEVRVALVARGDRAAVSVQDDGLGIGTADLGRLFTRFGRIVTTENSHIPGTGLGLYLSRELAVLHGGEITAVSTEGKGSTFTLELPLAGPSGAPEAGPPPG